jgi:thioredoxin
MVIVIEDKAAFDKALEDAGDKLVVVDFTATWCGPCKMISPTFHKMADDNPDCVFLQVDVDDADDVAAACEINSMPTFQFYKNKAKVGQFSGANKEKLTEMFNSFK